MPARKKTRSTGSGSPPAGEPEYLVVGSLRRPHGVHGEMVMEVLTDFPERLQAGTSVYVGDLHEHMTIETMRVHSEGMLIRFRGIETPEAAGNHRNQAVYVTAGDRPPLPEGQFYEHQVLGFAVIDDERGEQIGTLSEILRTGANDIYVVARPDDSELLLPVISSVVLSIDGPGRSIHVHLLPGLMDEPED